MCKAIPLYTNSASDFRAEVLFPSHNKVFRYSSLLVSSHCPAKNSNLMNLHHAIAMRLKYILKHLMNLYTDLNTSFSTLAQSWEQVGDIIPRMTV